MGWVRWSTCKSGWLLAILRDSGNEKLNFVSCSGSFTTKALGGRKFPASPLWTSRRRGEFWVCSCVCVRQNSSVGQFQWLIYQPTFSSHSVVTIGVPLATAHRNLRVRRTLSVTRQFMSDTPLAMLPPKRARTFSPASSTTPVNSTCGRKKHTLIYCLQIK